MFYFIWQENLTKNLTERNQCLVSVTKQCHYYVFAIFEQFRTVVPRFETIFLKMKA